MSSIQDIINLLYLKHKKSYLSSYGTDILFSIVIIYIYSVAITYYYVKNHLPQLRKNWPKNRCNPLYMPFASLVLKNSKDPANKIIEDNFSGCINTILHSIVQDALAPIYYAKKLAQEGVEDAVNAVDSIRGFFNTIRNDITDTAKSISGRTLNVMIPPTHMAITTRDSLWRIKGVYTSGIYMMIATYLTMKSAIMGIIHMLVIVILVSLVATIVGLMAIPFVGWGLAAIPIALAIAIMIPTVPIIIKFNNIFQGNTSTNMPHW
jgi:hypothetical protein